MLDRMLAFVFFCGVSFLVTTVEAGDNVGATTSTQEIDWRDAIQRPPQPREPITFISPPDPTSPASIPTQNTPPIENPASLTPEQPPAPPPDPAFITKTLEQYRTAELNLSQIATPVEPNPEVTKDSDVQTLLQSSVGEQFKLTKEQASIALRDGGFLKDGVRYELWQAKPGVTSGTFYVTELPAEAKHDKVFRDLNSTVTEQTPKNQEPIEVEFNGRIFRA